MTFEINRRRLIAGGAAAGLLLAVGGVGLVWRKRSRWRPDALGANGWLRIAPDGTITLLTNVADLGQGSASGLAELVAAELDADWSAMRLGPLPVQPAAFGSNGYFTGGSSSMRRLYRPLRTMAAAARLMLIGAAAARWRVTAADCTTRAGRVLHAPTGRSASYGELAADASRMPVPRAPELRAPLPLPARRSRLDVPAKVDGSTIYGSDFRLPGMLYAAVATAPFSGSRLTQCNDAAALARRGVKRVLKVADAVAVLGENSYAALQGLEALQCAWEVKAEVSGLAQQAMDSLTASAALSSPPEASATTDKGVAERMMTFDYAVPALAHVALEPISGVAVVSAGRAEIWISTQVADSVRTGVAQRLGISADAVTIHPLPCGGGFGRRLDSEYALQIVDIAAAAAVPVRVFWSREQDTACSRFRPAATAQARVRVGGAEAQLEATLRVASLGERQRLDGLQDQPYRGAKLRAESVGIATPLRVGPWRSVDYSQNVFFLESLVNDAARAMRQDPLLCRRRWLGDNSRALRVLDAVAAAANWNLELAQAQGRGVALAQCFESVMAIVVQVTMRDATTVHIDRIWAAADVGIAISPGSVMAQIVGAINFGLSAAIHESMSFERGAAAMVNFDRYPVLRMPLSPQIDVTLVAGESSLPGGVGELGVPATAPALVAAIAAASGRAIRRLPLAEAGLGFV